MFSEGNYRGAVKKAERQRTDAFECGVGEDSFFLSLTFSFSFFNINLFILIGG